MKLTKICKYSVTVLDYIDIKHFNHCEKSYWTVLLPDPLSEKKEGTSRVNSYKIDYCYCCYYYHCLIALKKTLNVFTANSAKNHAM